MPTVNYLRVIGSGHVAAKGVDRNEGRLQDRPPKYQEKPIKAYLYKNKLINPQRYQIALALMSPLEVHRALEWQQINRAAFLFLQQINK